MVAYLWNFLILLSDKRTEVVNLNGKPRNSQIPGLVIWIKFDFKRIYSTVTLFARFLG